jgi:hypothetical protein
MFGLLCVIHKLGGTGTCPPPAFNPPTLPNPAAPNLDPAPPLMPTVEVAMEVFEESRRVGWKGTASVPSFPFPFPPALVGLYIPLALALALEYGPGIASFGAGRPPAFEPVDIPRSLWLCIVGLLVMLMGLRERVVGLLDIMMGLLDRAVGLLDVGIGLATIPVPPPLSLSDSLSLLSRSRIEWEREVDECWRFIFPIPIPILSVRLLDGLDGFPPVIEVVVLSLVVPVLLLSLIVLPPPPIEFELPLLLDLDIGRCNCTVEGD